VQAATAAVEISSSKPAQEGIQYARRPGGARWIRWSDAATDFRTEIPGPDGKTQMVKNAVIVTVGSKGGSTSALRQIKRKGRRPRRSRCRPKAIACYQTLIRGMLDIHRSTMPIGGIRPPANQSCA